MLNSPEKFLVDDPSLQAGGADMSALATQLDLTPAERKAREVEMCYLQRQAVLDGLVALEKREFYESEMLIADDNVVSLSAHRRLRGERRRVKRHLIRGQRPEDPVLVRTVPWYRRTKREMPRHPRYRRTMLRLFHDKRGLLSDVVRKAPKPAADERERCRQRAELRTITSELGVDELPPKRHHLDPDYLLEKALYAGDYPPIHDDDPLPEIGDMVIVNDVLMGGPGWSVDIPVAAL